MIRIPTSTQNIHPGEPGDHGSDVLEWRKLLDDESPHEKSTLVRGVQDHLPMWVYDF